jgi:hypothetical protein
MKKLQYGIGQPVVTKGLTSPSITGRIVAIIYGRLIQPLWISNDADLSPWDLTDENWRDKLVYCVFKDKDSIPLFDFQQEMLEMGGQDVNEIFRSPASTRVGYYMECEVDPCPISSQ